MLQLEKARTWQRRPNAAKINKKKRKERKRKEEREGEREGGRQGGRKGGRKRHPPNPIKQIPIQPSQLCDKSAFPNARH